MSQCLHASSVALYRDGGWRGALIMGASGAGKSDLALRLLETGCRLVSDDYSWVWASGGVLYAAAPPTIAGQIEARGLGIVEGPTTPLARLILAVQLQDAAPERLPESETLAIVGGRLPVLRLQPFQASASAKVAAALRRL